MNKKKLKVLVAMSGGVDSSVAAKLLVDQGYKVAGVFLHFWSADAFAGAKALVARRQSLWRRSADKQEGFNKCCSSEALEDARRVCQKIGIPFYTLNFSQVFKRKVVDNFLKEYKTGRTPNPCVRCNKLVKLGLLIKKARKLGFDYVATGHYVRSKKLPARFALRSKAGGEVRSKKYIYKLYRAQDKNKDQSYFLYALNQAQLKHLLFPLANYTKMRVRKMARKFKLPVAGKKESQEICFIPEKSPNDFLRRHLKLKPGPIKLLTPPKPLLIKEGNNISYPPLFPLTSPYQGEVAVGQRGGKWLKADGVGGVVGVIGQHHGLPFYTIGQRKGIKIGGIGPFYVAKKDFNTNTLYVVRSSDDPALYSDTLIARQVNWISGKKPKPPLACYAVIRYGHEAVKCTITPLSPHPLLLPLSKGEKKRGGPPLARGRKEEGVIVKFAKPQRAVTAGQSVVLYGRGSEVLGGGIIE